MKLRLRLDQNILNLALDPIVNFGKVTLSTGYLDTDTTPIILNTGDGSKLPNPSTDGSFNLVWWNWSDYPDPSDDPNVEIVRCIARSGDILSITRGQENSSPSTKNLLGKTYKMILAPTKKIFTDIPTDAQSRVNAHSGLASSVHNFDASGKAPPQIHGGESHQGNIQVKTTNYTATISDDTILCNATSGAITITLPNSSARTGKIYNIKKTDSSSNSVTITRSGSDSIEGYNTKTITTQWGYYTIQSDGVSNWIILSSTSGLASLGPFIETSVLYNSTPQSGLIDAPIRRESFTYSN